MSGRSHSAPHDLKGPLPPIHAHPPSFVDGLGPLPATHHRQPAIFDETRNCPPLLSGGVRGSGPLQPALIEERLADQHHEIQGLLFENQQLVAANVALKQELASVHHELQRFSHSAVALQDESDDELREIYANSMKMEAELTSSEAMRAEIIQVWSEIQKLNAARRDLAAHIQILTQDLSGASAELQQAPAIKAEVKAMKQEVQLASGAVEYEKKPYAENYEQGPLIEKNLILMAREVENLHPEAANAEKRARVAEAAENQGTTSKLIFSFSPEINFSINGSKMLSGGIIKFGSGFDNITIIANGLAVTPVEYRDVKDNTPMMELAVGCETSQFQIAKVSKALSTVLSKPSACSKLGQENINPKKRMKVTVSDMKQFITPSQFEIGSASVAVRLTRTQRRNRRRRIKQKMMDRKRRSLADDQILADARV